MFRGLDLGLWFRIYAESGLVSVIGLQLIRFDPFRSRMQRRG